MSKRWYIFLVALFCGQFAVAQTKQTTFAQQIWLGYFNQTRLSNKWGIWVDGSIRTKEHFFTGLYQGVIRVGLSYYVNDATRITAGYAFMNHFPGDNHKDISQPEHRLWQQLQWQNGNNKIRTNQRLRLEQRYRRKILNDSTLADGYGFNYRLRYNYQLQIPLKKIMSDKVCLTASDEIMVNFGKEIVYNYFDQNRFFVGFGYQVNGTNQLQIGYMNLFQQLSSGNNYRMVHVARIFYFHNLDVRKK
jgi:hypothetical protein